MPTLLLQHLINGGPNNRVAENLSLHWHTQEGTRASLGPLPASSIVKTALPSPTKTRFTNANITHKCTLICFGILLLCVYQEIRKD